MMTPQQIKANAPEGAKKYNPETGQYYKGRYIFRGVDWVRVYFFPDSLISLNHYAITKPL
jgi:hypothetical protein